MFRSGKSRRMDVWVCVSDRDRFAFLIPALIFLCSACLVEVLRVKPGGEKTSKEACESLQ